MLAGASRTIFVIYPMFPGLNMYSVCTGHAHHLTTADRGSAVDYLDYLDRDLCKV